MTVFCVEMLYYYIIAAICIFIGYTIAYVLEEKWVLYFLYKWLYHKK